MKTQTTFLALTLATLLATAADAPTIDEARINAAISRVEAQVQANGGALVPDDQRQAFRGQITRELQRAEVLKNAALAAGLDKDASVQNQLKNLEAQFYATQYIEHLKNTMSVSDSDLYLMYERLGREVKVQIAVFHNKDEARAAQAKLLKGMSFTDLISSLSNQPEFPTDFISSQMLPPEFAQSIDSMGKGKISTDPVAYQGVYYLFKVADARKGANQPPFDQVKPRLIEQRKDEMVRVQVQKLLSDHGLNLE